MEDKEVKIEEVSIQDADKKQVEEKTEKDPIAEMADKLAEMNDKYLRLAAELENTRRRSALDAESRARTRAMGVAEKILPVMDAVQMALKHNPDDVGIQSLERALKSSFDQIGITKIESVGQILNPMLHNAIQVVEVPEDKKVAPNTIVDEMQAGYMFGDNVLRTAMVVVAK
ncbi:MAG: nucleotide exchange factor GrpE [Alphaproteobacteria bacterium]|nr:nucleotide exchange factor GrpE [Alphaproteobacteria bacterium]